MGNTSRFDLMILLTYIIIVPGWCLAEVVVPFVQKIWSHNIAKGAVKTHGFDLPRVLGGSWGKLLLKGFTWDDSYGSFETLLSVNWVLHVNRNMRCKLIIVKITPGAAVKHTHTHTQKNNICN